MENGNQSDSPAFLDLYTQLFPSVAVPIVSKFLQVSSPGTRDSTGDVVGRDSTGDVVGSDDFNPRKKSGKRFLLWVGSDCFRASGALTEQALVSCNYGIFLKFRKSERLQEWLLALQLATCDRSSEDQNGSFDVVVVTSWKNAKSNLQAIQSDPRLIGSVSIFVVLCDDGVRSMANASAWLDTLPVPRPANILLCQSVDVVVNSLTLWRALHEG